MLIKEHCNDSLFCETKISHRLNSNLVSFPQSRLGGTLHSHRKTSRQLFSVLPPPLLLRNWPVLHWLERLTLPSSSPLHHPAVAPLTCKAHCQKACRGFGWSLQAAEGTDPLPTDISCSHTQQIQNLSRSVPTSLSLTNPARSNLHRLLLTSSPR